jgi:hypothetical protein
LVIIFSAQLPSYFGIILQTATQADSNIAPLALKSGICGLEIVPGAERSAKHVLFHPIPRTSN